MALLTEAQKLQIKKELAIPLKNIQWFLSSASIALIDNSLNGDYSEEELNLIESILTKLDTFHSQLDQFAASAGVLETTETKLDSRRSYRLTQLRIRDELNYLQAVTGIEVQSLGWADSPAGVNYSW